LLDWIPLCKPRNIVLLAHERKNAGNGHRSSTAPALPSLSLAGLSSAGSPIDVLDDNALGSFVFGTRYTRMDCYNDLGTDIATRLSWVPVIWGWGGYLLAETPNGLTLLSWSSAPEWLGFLV
jgi:hypothetical protein